MTSFWWRHQITSPKLRHQNDVTKIFHFQAPSLCKVLVAPLLRVLPIKNNRKLLQSKASMPKKAKLSSKSKQKHRMMILQHYVNVTMSTYVL